MENEKQQWAQVTELNNSDEICAYDYCNEQAILEYAFDDSVFYYCKYH